MAMCDNDATIGAGFNVYWETYPPSYASAAINGYTRPFYVRAEGSLYLICAGALDASKYGSGFDKEDCFGVPDGNTFVIECP
jgi:hypothetical protein